METEIWNTIPGYDNYKVSNLGRFYNKKTGTYKSPSIKDNGYLIINISDGHNVNTKSAHRIVAMQFVQNPENKPCVNHKNMDRTDNRAENLEWCTYSENQLHSYKNNKNRFRRGQKIKLYQSLG